MSVIGEWRGKLAITVYSWFKNPATADHLADIVIKVEDQTFRCHKVLLAAVSPFFFAMFTNDFKEKYASEIQLTTVKASVFEGILKFLYGREDVVNPQNVAKYLEAASSLQIKALQDRCEEVLNTNLEVSNVIGIWKITKVLNCKVTIELSRRKMLDWFEDLRHEQEFLALDFEELINLIKDDFLVVKQEESVAEAVMDWMNKDKTKRKPQLKQIFEYIKFPLMSARYLYQITEKYPFLNKEKRCREIIEEAKRCIMLPEERAEVDPRRVSHRLTSSQADVILVIQASDTQATIAYNTRSKKWYSLSRLPYRMGRGYAVCVANNDVYVTGGEESKNRFVKYSTAFDKWIDLKRLPFQVLFHSSVYMNNEIVILGGTESDPQRPTSSVRSCSLVNGAWTRLGSLTRAITQASATTVRNSILVLGGRSGGEMVEDVIQQFNMETRQCTLLSRMTQPVSLPGACYKYPYLFYINGSTVHQVRCYNEGSLENTVIQRAEITGLQGNGILSTATCNNSWYLIETSLSDSTSRRIVSFNLQSKVVTSISLPPTGLIKIGSASHLAAVSVPTASLRPF